MNFVMEGERFDTTHCNKAVTSPRTPRRIAPASRHPEVGQLSGAQRKELNVRTLAS